MTDALLTIIGGYVCFGIFFYTKTNTEGIYLSEKIFGMSKTQKDILDLSNQAVSQSNFTIIQALWVPMNNRGEGSKLGYKVIFHLNLGDIKVDWDRVSIKKPSSESFEECPDLQSSHLIMLARKTARSIL